MSLPPTTVSESKNSSPGTAWLVLALSATVPVLYGLSLALKRLPCVLLLPVIALAAWPIWRYQADRVLFERRAILASVSTEAGRLRKWFWAGRVTSVLQVFVALFLAALLLGFLSALQTPQWLVLAGDALLLALIFNRVKQGLGGQIREEHRGFVARRWILTAINAVVVLTLLVGLEYFYLDQPDTRGLPWHEVAERAFNTAQSSANCLAAGAFLGLTAALDQTAWHAAMSLIPGLSDPLTKILAWLVFLAWTVFGALVFTRCLLGVMTLVEGDARQFTFSRVFLYTILALAVPYLYAAIRFAEGNFWSQLTAVVAEDPCRKFEFDTGALQVATNDEVRLAQTEARTHAGQRIDAALDTAFGAAEKGVDRYLDWYFSLIGEYTRLGTIVTGNVDQMMRQKLSQYLFDEPDVAGIIGTASAGLEGETASRMSGVAESVGARIGDTVDAAPCPVAEIDVAGLLDLRRDKLRVAVSATLGTAAGTLTARFLAKRAVAGAAGRLAAKSTVRSAGKLLARGATKRGASVLLSAAASTGICSPAGPMAVLCGAVAGGVTWISVDKAMIEIDESLFRDQMRKELLQGLTEQRKSMENELKTRHLGLVDAYALEIDRATARVFNPSRDGL